MHKHSTRQEEGIKEEDMMALRLIVRKQMYLGFLVIGWAEAVRQGHIHKHALHYPLWYDWARESCHQYEHSSGSQLC